MRGAIPSSHHTLMICGDRVTGDEPRAAVGPEEHSAAVKDAPQTLSLST